MDFVIDGQISSFCPDQPEETIKNVSPDILDLVIFTLKEAILYSQRGKSGKCVTN
jgi:hypothetical protein